MLSRAASESLAALDSVSVDGSDAGIAASSRRGSTSKGTKVFQTCTNNLNKFFNNSGNFWFPPSRVIHK
jgi:hypothetical protein